MKDRIILIKDLIENKGYTQTQCANELGINPKNMNYYIKKYNIKVTNKNRKHFYCDDYFENINSSKKAYLLGYVLADGCITNNRLSIETSIDDLEIIQQIKQEIAPQNKISFREKNKKGVNRKRQCCIKITSKKITDDLKNIYGIHERKTYNENFLFDFNLIPQIFLKDFIRGYFDGDGSVSFYLTNTTIYFNFSFIFNSLKFAWSFCEIFENLFNIEKVIYSHKGKTCNYYSARFRYGRKRQKIINDIYNWLYKDADIYLNRKKKKFNEYLEYRGK